MLLQEEKDVPFALGESEDGMQENWFFSLVLLELPFDSAPMTEIKVLKFATKSGCIISCEVNGSNTCLPHSSCIKFSDV